MKRKLIITVEHLPYPELSPNARHHWAVKARAVKASREEIGWLAKVQWHDDEPMIKARISYEFHVKDRRVRDTDNLLNNLTIKSWVDGLVDVGVLLLDDMEHLEIGSVRVLRADADGSIITVEEL